MYGDTLVMRKRAAQLREQGEDIRAMAEQLVTRSDEVAWSGRSRIRGSDQDGQGPNEHHASPGADTRRHHGNLHSAPRLGRIGDALLGAYATISGYCSPTGRSSN